MHRTPNQTGFNPFKHRVNPVKNWKDLEIDHPIKLALGKETTPNFSLVLNPAMLLKKKQKNIRKKYTAKEEHDTKNALSKTRDQLNVQEVFAHSHTTNVAPMRAQKRQLDMEAQSEEVQSPKRPSRRCIGGAR